MREMLKQTREEKGMRLKKVPGALERIQESKYYVNNPESYRGKWKEVFQNHNNKVH